MSNPTTFSLDVTVLLEPTGRKPVWPELISGDPSFRSWVQDISFHGEVRSDSWGGDSRFDTVPQA